MKIFFNRQIYIKIPKYKQLQKNKCVGIVKNAELTYHRSPEK
jgi:hypothetical protein